MSPWEIRCKMKWKCGEILADIILEYTPYNKIARITGLSILNTFYL